MKTLGELESTIADYLNRTDLAARIPTFITNAELKIYRGLRIRDNEFLQIIVTDPDDIADPPAVNPVSPITLPENFREMKMLVINDVQVPSVTDQGYQYSVATGNRADNRPAFTVINRQLYITPWATENPDPWDDTTIEIHYYGTESIYQMSTWNVPVNPVDAPPQVEATTSFDGQTSTNTTRLFQVASDGYLYGALMEASMFLINDSRVPMWESAFSKAMMSLKNESKRAMYAGSTNSVSSVN